MNVSTSLERMVIHFSDSIVWYHLALKTKGIFRVNGSEKRIADMITEFDSAPTYGLGWYLN